MNILLQMTIATVVVVFFLTGCETQKEIMLKEGYPVSYADGFEDGCHSGKKAGGNMFEQFKKDPRRFEVDSQYGQGWSDGFRQCETEEESMQRQMRINLQQQQYMDTNKSNDKKAKRRMERKALKGIDTRGLENM